MIRIIAEIVSVFDLPETDLGYSRAAGIAVLLGREDVIPGYHKCLVCGALIPPQEFTNPFDGKPHVAYGDPVDRASRCQGEVPTRYQSRPDSAAAAVTVGLRFARSLVPTSCPETSVRTTP